MPELWTSSGGVNRKLKELYTPSGGVNRKLKDLYAASGGVNRKIFSGSIPATELPVGTTVKLLENGALSKYKIVHQGLPSSQYAASCNGTWVMKLEQYTGSVLFGNRNTVYSTSIIATTLKSFTTRFASDVRAFIKTVKIPYSDNYMTSTGLNRVWWGDDGYSCDCFAPSFIEVGGDSSMGLNVAADGAKLAYFQAGSSSFANALRSTFSDGSAYWLRSVFVDAGEEDWTFSPLCVDTIGNIAYVRNQTRQIRPVMILSSDAKFSGTPDIEGAYILDTN